MTRVEGIPVDDGRTRRLSADGNVVSSPRISTLITAEERAFYESVANDELTYQTIVDSLRAFTPMKVGPLGHPMEAWVDAPYDSVAQVTAYQYLIPTLMGTPLQLGGHGTHAIKFLIAGAHQALLLTPIPAEARIARRVAKEFGVNDRFEVMVGVGEAIPLKESSVSAIYSGGCLHHTSTQHSIREIHRVLEPGGRFAAAELWRAPLYSVGITLFGKREPDVHCQPLDPERIHPILQYFPDAELCRHGALFRYPLLAASKLGIRVSTRHLFRIAQMEERLTMRHPRIRHLGGSLSLCMTKQA